MKQHQETLTIGSSGQKLHEITGEVQAVVEASGVTTGIAHVFCRHTSASLVIQENADPDVRHDLEAFMRRLVPDGDPAFIHTVEGPDDMSAHIKAALTATSLSIPVSAAKLALGAWQGVYLFEHRTAPQRRRVVVHVIGS
jgi:secondary thiamine-phosphate synthase enzyme